MAEVEVRKNIFQKMVDVQSELKAPKDKENTFGKYKYRSAEGILEAVKPLLKQNELVISVTDSIEAVGDRVYVKATVTIIDVHTGDKMETSAYAREAFEKKGMDSGQVTGATSSYARKYALNGMFAIDDSKDLDTDEYRNEGHNRSNSAIAEQNAKKQACNELAKKAKEVGITNDVIKAIIQQKYNAESSKDMSIGAIKNMTTNLEALATEFTA